MRIWKAVLLLAGVGLFGTLSIIFLLSLFHSMSSGVNQSSATGVDKLYKLPSVVSGAGETAPVTKVTDKKQKRDYLPFPQQVKTLPETMQDVPRDILALLNDDDMSLEDALKVKFDTGESGYRIDFTHKKSLLDAYSGWKNRLRGWKLNRARRDADDVTLDFQNSKYRVFVSINEKINSPILDCSILILVRF